MKLYAVGGAVRDHFRGMHGSNDFDFAVEAESYDAMFLGLRERGLHVWQERPEFVSIRGRMPLDSLGEFAHLFPKDLYEGDGANRKYFINADFTLCRKEAQYFDRRHPSEVTPADLLTDLSRRDFTMNAIAIAEDGTVIDPFDGRRDIEDRVLRTVGKAVDRFQEDPLRMLRALRFSSTMRLWMASDIYYAMRDMDNYHLLTLLPVERVANELQIALRSNWAHVMRLLVIEFPGIGRTLKDSWPQLWFKPTTEGR
jgi:tRNA nucleotidyltransferase (CCA-adding enzyme)